MASNLRLLFLATGDGGNGRSGGTGGRGGDVGSGNSNFKTQNFSGSDLRELTAFYLTQMRILTRDVSRLQELGLVDPGLNGPLAVVVVTSDLATLWQASSRTSARLNSVSNSSCPILRMTYDLRLFFLLHRQRIWRFRLLLPRYWRPWR